MAQAPQLPSFHAIAGNLQGLSGTEVAESSEHGSNARTATATISVPEPAATAVPAATPAATPAVPAGASSGVPAIPAGLPANPGPDQCPVCFYCFILITFAFLSFISSIDAMPARIHNATLRNKSDLIYPPVPAGIVPGEGILPKTKLDLVILAGESLLSLLHPLI